MLKFMNLWYIIKLICGKCYTVIDAVIVTEVDSRMLTRDY